MPSKTSICNLAVGWLGGNLITDVDVDTSKEATLCNANYDDSRKLVLEAADWNFARELHALLPAGTSPDFGYSNRFLIPEHALVLRKCSLQASDLAPQSYWETRNSDFQYMLRGQFIEAHAEKLYTSFTMDVTDPKLYSSTFIHALAAHIAMSIAVPLTESGTHEDRMTNKYANYLREAMSIDGVQSKSKRINSDVLLRVR